MQKRKSLDNQDFWNVTIDHMAASEWVEHGLSLDARHNTQKVSRMKPVDDNILEPSPKNFSFSQGSSIKKCL